MFLTAQNQVDSLVVDAGQRVIVQATGKMHMRSVVVLPGATAVLRGLRISACADMSTSGSPGSHIMQRTHRILKSCALPRVCSRHRRAYLGMTLLSILGVIKFLKNLTLHEAE